MYIPHTGFVPGRSSLPKSTTGITLTPLGLKASKLDTKNFAIVSAKRISTTTPSTVNDNIIALTATSDSLFPIKNQLLEEVIVTTGLYKKAQREFAGSATTVSGEELHKVNSVNVLDALKVPGPPFAFPMIYYMAVTPTGYPLLRCVALITFRNKQPAQRLHPLAPISWPITPSNPNQPLFILDGFEVSLQKIYDLDINRVAGFTI